MLFSKTLEGTLLKVFWCEYATSR